VTHHDLIAAAARAAGIHQSRWDFNYLAERGVSAARDMLWNPIDNSGDALELAVKLDMRVDVEGPTVEVWARGGQYAGETTDGALTPAAATRLAITRAAAATAP